MKRSTDAETTNPSPKSPERKRRDLREVNKNRNKEHVMRRAFQFIMMTVAVAAHVGMSRDAEAQGGTKPPFSQIYSRPAVSPYTMLGGQNAQGNGGGLNMLTGAQQPLIYQQIIQPQLQQQQQVIEQQSQTRQLGRLQNQVQQIQRDTRGRQVDETIRPTGHASTYQNLSHFYPGSR